MKRLVSLLGFPQTAIRRASTANVQGMRLATQWHQMRIFLVTAPNILARGGISGLLERLLLALSLSMIWR